MSAKDIVPYQFTSEQSRKKAAENGAKGGVASGIAKREKAQVKKYVLSWLEDSGRKDRNGEPIPGAEVLAKRLVKGCKEGNTKMIELVLALADQKPAEKIMVAEIDPEIASQVESMVHDTD